MAVNFDFKAYSAKNILRIFMFLENYIFLQEIGENYFF